ncbi:serine--tRNA ligase [Sulfurimonas sp. MAG313]|nr:serine--tRNA ligase [Sulfurimonas sp. MAG313]MDF1882068.1 serine--tRNA ligase [Sulfurimonas sp. MAG313]
MIDIKLLHKDFDAVASMLQRRKIDPSLLEELKSVHQTYKSVRQELEAAQATQNEKSKLFGQYMREKKDISELKKEVDANKILISEKQELTNAQEEKLNIILRAIPNIPDDDVPVGVDEDENIEIKKVLEPKTFSFTPKEHWDLAENGWIDFEKGVKVAKSRFSVIAGMGAKIERALVNFMLDFNAERGFTEVSVPVITNKPCLMGTGQLPKFEDDLYKIEGEDLYLIPTGEVPVTNLFQDEIIPMSELPVKMTAFTQCFRKEAGAAGRDTRGIIRQHQFPKVELVAISSQEDSDKVFEEMVACASDLLEALGLPYKQMQLCTGDMGFSAARTIDLEVWLPGQNCYREISSISNTRDFQARRAKIRYKDGKKNILAHTLNGSSLAVGRTMVAIMENYQNEDGSIDIPEVLKPYIR